jgi:hypothetical protein
LIAPALLLLLAQVPDGGVVAFHGDATSAIEVTGGKGVADRSGAYISERWKVTNRTWETPTIHYRGELLTAVVRRTVEKEWDSGSDGLNEQISLEFFTDYTHGNPATFRFERRANEIALETYFMDVIAWQFTPLPREHELVDYGAQKPFLKCTGDYAQVTVPNTRFRGYLGYDAVPYDPKKPLHGRLVFATSERTVSEVTFRNGKGNFMGTPELRLVANDKDLLKGPVRAVYEWWPKGKSATGETMPSFKVRLTFGGDEPHVVELPVVEGKFVLKDAAVLQLT